MAAITDLTWQQVLAELPASAIVVTAGKVMIDASLVAGLTVDALTDMGVVKFFAALSTAANKAQVAANVAQAEGEKLAAFAPATVGTATNGFITLTRPFVCRSELSTATNVIGQVA